MRRRQVTMIRLCSRCGEYKRCDSCRKKVKEIAQKYRQNHQELRKYSRDYSKRYYTKNKEVIQEKRREHHGKNRENENIAHKRWYEQNREHVLEYARNYYLKNIGVCNERCREWGKRNEEYKRVIFKKYYSTHKVEIDARSKATKRYRRAVSHGNGGRHTQKELDVLFKEQQGICPYCEELLFSSFDNPINVEHMVPISRGGTNDISNIVLAHEKCNFKKGTKTYEEYIIYLNKYE